MSFRAKMFVGHLVKADDDSRAEVNLYGVYESLPDVSGNACEENRIFGEYTPSASVQMTIHNPEVVRQLEPGKQFYVDFTPVE